uniref:Murine leukemia virus integrase C-terminal domain-containing protein n=1 Tax=Molossus molossus TaxID=27622 RepID=A0A7J8BI89_MOLMO|nr:hypothetical protein HJG59_010442 [Molossus molossus]
MKDTPLTNSDYELYMDGSSYLKNGQRYPRAAITTEHQSLQAIQAIRKKAKLLADQRPQPKTASPPALDIELGDWIWTKKFNKETLEPTWEGPHFVILSTSTAFKVAGRKHWIHNTQQSYKDTLRAS